LHLTKQSLLITKYCSIIYLNGTIFGPRKARINQLPHYHYTYYVPQFLLQSFQWIPSSSTISSMSEYKLWMNCSHFIRETHTLFHYMHQLILSFFKLEHCYIVSFDCICSCHKWTSLGPPCGSELGRNMIHIWKGRINYTQNNDNNGNDDDWTWTWLCLA
jgi:hypothetical protein